MPPSHVYKGGEGRGGRPKGGAILGLPSPSRIPLLFPIRSRREGKRGRGRRKRGGAPPLVQFGLGRRGGRAPPLGPSPLSPLKPNKAHYFSRRIPVTLRYSEKYPNHSEPFRYPNIVVQYIDLYVSTILRLLVMSVISSGTLNNLRYIKSHNS